MHAIVLGLLLVGCGEVTGAGSAGPGHLKSPSVTLPPDVPQQIRDHVAGLLRAPTVRRIDTIGARLVTWREFHDSLGVGGTTRSGEVWVVAATGEFAQDRGLIDMGLSPCRLWAFDATALTVAAGGSGSLSTCARYIAGVATPPDAPVVCGAEPKDYAYRHGNSPVPGRVSLLISRDDAWRLPTSVPGWAIYDGLNQYETFCRIQKVIVAPDSHSERMLRALGPPRVSPTTGQAQIWLKNYHAVEAIAGADAVKVVVEPRVGFEIASFDWRSVAPPTGANYIRFEFVDRAGRELTFTVANGP